MYKWLNNDILFYYYFHSEWSPSSNFWYMDVTFIDHPLRLCHWYPEQNVRQPLTSCTLVLSSLQTVLLWVMLAPAGCITSPYGHLCWRWATSCLKRSSSKLHLWPSGLWHLSLWRVSVDYTEEWWGLYCTFPEMVAFNVQKYWTVFNLDMLF